jgi:hypothetical protein
LSKNRRQKKEKKKNKTKQRKEKKRKKEKRGGGGKEGDMATYPWSGWVPGFKMECWNPDFVMMWL